MALAWLRIDARAPQAGEGQVAKKQYVTVCPDRAFVRLLENVNAFMAGMVPVVRLRFPHLPALMEKRSHLTSVDAPKAGVDGSATIRCVKHGRFPLATVDMEFAIRHIHANANQDGSWRSREILMVKLSSPFGGEAATSPTLVEI